ncbi:hypothetical protein FRC00_004864 [Tulasnella sp. 408]|nr:hypothetical protein FRC00_004864 [Tulasnella sp. 408]
MTSIDSLPPELLHQIFHWATYDYALSAKLPTWKNYSLLGIDDSENPWPMLYLGMEREATARALRLTCARWTALATEFELYYIMINDVPTLKYYRDRIKKWLEKDGEGENKLKCPVRFMNLRLHASRSVWTEEDTEIVVSLIRDSPNLEIMVNSCSMPRETHAAGLIILQSLVTSCPNLKRLHWKPKYIMQLLPSSWSSILSSSSLATSLEVLEIMACPPGDAVQPIPAPALQLELPSLHCLQLSVDDDNAPLTSVIAKEWQLPSLSSLYIQGTYMSTFSLQNGLLSPGVASLITTYGQSGTALAIDSRTARYISLDILPPVPIQELVYGIYGLERSRSLPLTALSTLVLPFAVGNEWPLITAVWRTLEQLQKLRDYSLPKLKKVVVLSLPFDDLKEPHRIDLQFLDEAGRLLVEPWQQETPILVNRNGVRLFILIGMDQVSS